MEFPFQLDILDVIFKGVLIGILASAPMGPVGVLCVQRTLNKGRWYGFVTGIGACVSDIIYALFTGYGMSYVMDIINSGNNRFILQISGSLMLLGFGIYSYFSNPKQKVHISGKRSKGSLIHNGITAFLVTFSNPLIIFLFMACFAQFAFVIPNQPGIMIGGYIGILAGALLWWYGLTWLIEQIKGKFDNNGIVIINKIIGAIVTLVSVVVIIGTVFNLYTFA